MANIMSFGSRQTKATQPESSSDKPSSRANSQLGWTALLLLAGALSALVLLGCDFSREQFSPSTPTSIPPTTTLPPETGAEPAPPGGSSATTGLGPAANGATTGRVIPVSIAAVRSDRPEYDRSTWRHWTDEDGDCQNTRQEVLIAESSVAVTFQSGEQCRVAAGLWQAPYTGTTANDPGNLDVDHMVPLENAHRSGGWDWSRERKREYANYLGYENHLIATSSRANRSKGSKGPEEWRPPLEAYWCVYAVDWVTIKNEWGLTVTETEYHALSEMLVTCEMAVLLQPAQGTPPLPTPTIPPSLPTDLRYDPFGPDRDCGDFDAYEEALAFYLAAGGPEDDRHRLDDNGDGLPCESLPGGPSGAQPPGDREGPSAAAADSNSVLAGDNIACISTGPPPGPSEVAFNQADCGPAAEPASGAPVFPLPTQAPIPSVRNTPTPQPGLTPMGPETNPEGSHSALVATADSLPVAPPKSTPVSPAFVNLPFDPGGPDRNCEDFSLWWDAQNFFLASGGPVLDPHRLDQNGDGTACESLLGETVGQTEVAANGAAGPSGDSDFEDRNCSDFATWQEANSFFEDQGGPHRDPHRLDRNGDGVPCESLPGAPKAGTTGDQQDAQSRPTPTPVPETRRERNDFQDQNCSDFETWREAQNFFLAEGGPSQDPHRLDGDGNEIACQSLPGSPSGQ